MSISTQPPLAPAETWPQQANEHPFDGPASEAESTAADRHERTHRQSSQDATVTGLDRWKAFRGANFRKASESWTDHAAWLRANGGSAEDIAAADFHARRFGRDAALYGPVAS